METDVKSFLVEEYLLAEKRYRYIVEALIAKFGEHELQGAARFAPTLVIVENVKKKPSKANKRTCAKVLKVPERFREIFLQLTDGRNVTHVLEIYRKNCVAFEENHYKVLLYHELKHVGMDGSLMPHDVEEWFDVLVGLGPRWPANEIPDLLQPDISWKNIMLARPGLWKQEPDEPNLQPEQEGGETEGEEGEEAAEGAEPEC